MLFKSWQARKNVIDLNVPRVQKKSFQTIYVTCIKTIIAVIILTPLLTLAPAQSIEEANGGVKVYCNGDFCGSTAYIDQTSGVGMVPLALIQSIPGLRLDVRGNQAWFSLNGQQLNSIVGTSSYTINGQSKPWRCGLQKWKYGIAVPGRELFEALGANVRWDENERAIYINTPVPTPTPPKSLGQTSLPLQMAIIKNDQLWLLDASKPGNQLLAVPSRNVEQIIGWSHDGKWLAYLQRSSIDKSSDENNLWIVSADVQQNQCLDELPVLYSSPVWSPTENTIAYQVQPTEKADFTDKSLRIASQENNKWKYHELLNSESLPIGSGLAWFPDGKSLAMSLIHDSKNPPELKQVDLKGEVSSLFVLPAALAGDYQDGLYTWDINGLKISPNGRYIACYLGINSASSNADGMSMQIIDLQQDSTFEVGNALGYPEWMAWSPDSRKLAAILGDDRVASHNKHLELVQISDKGFNLLNLGKTGQVDSRPVWSMDGSTLYFSRGLESEAWLEEGRSQEVQIPGQQIFSRKNDREQSLSKPGKEQADYLLSLSPDSQYLVMQRLSYFDLGTLCLMDTKNGQEIEIMSEVQVNAGFYGSYYPDVVSIYWLSSESKK